MPGFTDRKGKGKRFAVNYNLKIPKIDKVNYICVCMYACLYV